MIKNRYLQFLILILCAFIGGALSNYLMSISPAFAQARTVLSAHQLIITDSRGVIRASLNPAGSYEEYTGFSLHDNSGARRMTIQVNPDHRIPEISYWNSNGTRAAAPTPGAGGGGAVTPVQRISLSRGGKADSVGVSQGDLYPIITQLNMIMNKLDELASHH